MYEEDKKEMKVQGSPMQELNDDPMIGLLGSSDYSGEFKKQVLIPYFTDLYQVIIY